MKIAIIGSTQYYKKMIAYKKKMTKLGHTVRLPCLDNKPQLSEFEICAENFRTLAWADEVVVIWDSRSVGTVFDMGMTFAFIQLGWKKKVRCEYLEKKTFGNLLLQMEKAS